MTEKSLDSMYAEQVKNSARLAKELNIAKKALEKITWAYEADVYSLSDAIIIAEDTLDTLDKIEKGVTI